MFGYLVQVSWGRLAKPCQNTDSLKACHEYKGVRGGYGKRVREGRWKCGGSCVYFVSVKSMFQFMTIHRRRHGALMKPG
jgi:hypothetical protein